MPSSPAIDPTTVPASVGSSYPPEFAASSAQRQKRRLGDVFGLTAFGVNMPYTGLTATLAGRF